jgi:5-methylcytosine-specific restriction endonuclease McrA
MDKLYNSKARFNTLLKYKKYECEICKNPGIHLDKPLKLQVDHIDGNNKNHIINNLRFLCANCHSQSDNYAGRNAKFKNFNKPSKEEFKELYKNNTLQEISLIKAVSLRTVYN